MEYLKQRYRDCVRSFISDLQLKSIKSEMNWFKIKFADKAVSAITAAQLRDYLEKPKNQSRNRRKAPEVTSVKTWNNRRGLPSPSTAWTKATWCKISLPRCRSIRSTTAAPPPRR